MNEEKITDHLFGFVSWITTREQKCICSSYDNPTDVINLLSRYIYENNLPNVSVEYPNTFVTPKKTFDEIITDFELT